MVEKQPWFLHFQDRLAAVEVEMAASLPTVSPSATERFYGMMAYHLGWRDASFLPVQERVGKRVRPLLCLLACEAAGGDWRQAVPAAAAVELTHNFTLIHDDIEDNSPLRRGRPTVWNLWGVPQAINAGDAMFTLAHLALLRLAETVSLRAASAANQVLQQTCLRLTQGQYLDIAYETRRDLTEYDYWPMVSGKTAALLAASTQLGALAAGASPAICESFRLFGWLLGLAFQAQDDYLGIWGDAALTGKSAESDLVSGKKSLPVLIGLSRQGAFNARWAQGPIAPSEASHLAHLLELEGARAETLARADELTRQALEALDQAGPRDEAGIALRALAQMLLNRKV
jgi:geranylgeranyl diphosphate synthase type I